MMPRWFRITLFVLGSAGLCLGALFAYATWSVRNIDWNIAVYKEFDARDGIMLDLSNPACLTRETVIGAAQAQGWGVEDA